MPHWFQLSLQHSLQNTCSSMKATNVISMLNMPLGCEEMCDAVHSQNIIHQPARLEDAG